MNWMSIAVVLPEHEATALMRHIEREHGLTQIDEDWCTLKRHADNAVVEYAPVPAPSDRKAGADSDVEIYATALRHEMRANAYKGHWLEDENGDPVTDEGLLAELLYHAFKLARAARHRSSAGVLQYAADVGNCAWFIAAKHEALDEELLIPIGSDPIEYTAEAIERPAALAQLKEDAAEVAGALLLI